MAYKEQDITELIAYFESKEPIAVPIRLDAGQTIVDIEKFLETQFSILEGAYAPIKESAYQRLILLKKELDTRR